MESVGEISNGEEAMNGALPGSRDTPSAYLASRQSLLPFGLPARYCIAMDWLFARFRRFA